MTEHAEIMERIFKSLGDPETKRFVGSTDGWSPEAQEVLDALDAFADEQTVTEQTRAAYGEGPEEWLIGNNVFTDLPEWTQEDADTNTTNRL